MAQSVGAIQRGTRLEYLTIGWNSLEAIIAIGAGIAAGSISLVGFGLDSIIEVSSGAIILWRLFSGEHREDIALKLVGLSFLALATYIAFDAIKSLWFREAPEESYVGIGLAIVSLIVMPLLALNAKWLHRSRAKLCMPTLGRLTFALISPQFFCSALDSTL